MLGDDLMHGLRGLPPRPPNGSLASFAHPTNLLHVPSDAAIINIGGLVYLSCH